MTHRVLKSEFTGTRVQLDGFEYVECKFTRCTIVFSGTAPCSLVGSTFEECQWAFEGAATVTTSFLRAMYQSGNVGREMVERTLQPRRAPAEKPN